MKFYIIFFLLFELYTSFHFSTKIGFWWSLTEVILTSFIGIKILKNSQTSLSTLAPILMQKGASFGDIKKSIFKYVIGAVLLIIPGFITDIMGVITLVSGIPLLFKKDLQTKKPMSAANNKDYIDVEVL